MYQYINDPEFRMQAEYSGGYEFLDYGLSLMSKKQVYIYNYLHYQDSINGTDTADEYIELIAPKLREQSAKQFYSGIEDSKATKAIVEACIGFDGVGNGVKNTFGLNDDRDGVAMLTTADYTDNLIMSNVESTGEAVLYTVVKAGGASVSGVIVTFGIAGLGTLGLIASIGGNATIYGASAGGNAKSQAERVGHTPSQAKTNGLEVGAKETVKTGALKGICAEAHCGITNVKKYCFLQNLWNENDKAAIHICGCFFAIDRAFISSIILPN